MKVQGPVGNFTHPMPLWLMIYAKYIKINASFVWNYTDIFLMTLSMALTVNFKLYNAELKRVKFEVRNNFIKKMLG